MPARRDASDIGPRRPDGPSLRWRSRLHPAEGRRVPRACADADVAMITEVCELNPPTLSKGRDHSGGRGIHADPQRPQRSASPYPAIADDSRPVSIRGSPGRALPADRTPPVRWAYNDGHRRQPEIPPRTASVLVSGTRLGYEERAAKPSAQPTLVRTQHPPPAQRRPLTSTHACQGQMLHGPNAHATISGNSSRQNAPPCDPTRSVISTSAPASRSATAQRVAFSRKNGSSVPATR